MSRFLRLSAVAMAVLFASPSSAQVSFDGLDLPSAKKKAKKKKKKEAKARSSDEKPAKTASRKKSSSKKQKSSGKALEATKPPVIQKPAVTPKPAEQISAPAQPAPAISTESKAANLDANVPPPVILQKKLGKPAPTMTFDALDVSGKSSERQRLDAALQLFKSEHYDQAALSAREIMDDPKYAGLALDAQYLLGKSQYRMGMYHSSLATFSKILAKGPQGKFFKSSLEWLFFISHKTTNETVILDEIARYSNSEFPERFRNEFRYLLARYHLARGKALDASGQKAEADKSFAEVKKLVLTVPRADPFYPRAKYLEGLAYFRDDNFSAALESMKEVVRLTRASPDKTPTQVKLDQELRELAFMQLARNHYGHRQNRYAIYYYNKVERGNAQWLEALFEASWANYRIGQYEQALGNLITLSSPFFRDDYFPEAYILKAVIYYENCRYRESTMILEDFERTYLPVHDELELLLKKEMDASEYYTVLAEVQKKNKIPGVKKETDVILERVLRLALTDKDLKKTNDSILELEAELDGYSKKTDAFKYSNLSKEMIEELKKQRGQLIKKAGIMAKGKLEFELGELKKLLANGLRIKFETTTKEKEFLEEMLRAGGKAEIIRKYRYSVAVADDQLYWPFEGGEYWRDELGTYQYTLTKGCIERKAAKRKSDDL